MTWRLGVVASSQGHGEWNTVQMRWTPGTALRRVLALVAAGVLLLGCDPSDSADVGLTSENGHLFVYQCSTPDGIGLVEVNDDGGDGSAVWSARKIDKSKAPQRLELFAGATGYRTRGRRPSSLRNVVIGNMRDA